MVKEVTHIFAADMRKIQRTEVILRNTKINEAVTEVSVAGSGGLWIASHGSSEGVSSWGVPRTTRRILSLNLHMRRRKKESYIHSNSSIHGLRVRSTILRERLAKQMKARRRSSVFMSSGTSDFQSR